MRDHSNTNRAPNGKRGRPNKNVDPKTVEKLAAMNSSYEEMATIVNCSVSTLQRNFDQVIKKGRAEMKVSLKRTQYRVAMGTPAQLDENGEIVQKAVAPNPTMLIWLGKTVLGQVEHHQFDFTSLDDMTDEQLAAVVAGRIPRMR